MADLHAAIALLAVVSLGLYWLGRLLARRCSPRTCRVLALVVTMFLLAFAGMLHGRLVLATWIPWSNVIVLGNWIPLGAALLGGLCAGGESDARPRRAIILITLLGVAWYGAVAPLARAWLTQLERSVKADSRCQDSQVSCSAACAAKLLAWHGIEASEAEMARLCLTYRLGTPSLGLYRGLRIKTRGTRWDVDITRCEFETLRRSVPGPMLLRVRLSGPQVVRTFHDRPLGWSPGMDHMILLYGFSDSGRPAIWDPAVPHDPNYLWTEAELREHWCGEVVRLATRRGSVSSGLRRW